MVLRNLSDITVGDPFTHSGGAKAWACLHGHGHASSSAFDEPAALLTADFTKFPPQLIISAKPEVNTNLTHVLARVLAQWSLERFPAHGRIQLPDGTMYNRGIKSNADIEQLFDCLGEVVDMVNSFGSVLGKIPRRLVHEHNLLHRGIGLFVTNAPHLQPHALVKSRWYVHRRASTKRIFPDLYDMFVGGISLAGEDDHTTALREVQEELGLSQGRLSDPLLTCTVCTDYNRCFVTLFAYHINPGEESIRWQEEEVAWGQFCSYPIIQTAADASIKRLIERRAWPGRYSALHSTTSIPDPDKAGVCDWEAWDFVPDGLLVWEAWLEYQSKLMHEADIK
ncbi:hypothetical protein MPSEU_001045000 [Mayamaea pseudoterrestris]|nr:hypothetical protein MPSEU_001045000 [Mayamaea pseudoterrestris]